MEASEVIILIIILCIWTWLGFRAIMDRIVSDLVGIGQVSTTRDDFIEYFFYVVGGPFGWFLLIAATWNSLTNRFRS